MKVNGRLKYTTDDGAIAVVLDATREARPIQAGTLQGWLKELPPVLLDNLVVSVMLNGEAVTAVTAEPVPSRQREAAWRRLEALVPALPSDVVLFDPLPAIVAPILPGQAWHQGQLQNWRTSILHLTGGVQELRLKGEVVHDKRKFIVAHDCESLSPLWTDDNRAAKFAVQLQHLRDGGECLFQAVNNRVTAIRIPNLGLEPAPRDAEEPLAIPLPLRIPADTATVPPPPDAFHNPYAFVAPVPRNDADPIWGRHPAPSHSRFHDTLLSGTLRVQLTATSPYFSAGSRNESGNQTVLNPRHDITATGLKGAVRDLYETLTNSCFSVFDKSRRRVSYRLGSGKGKGPSELKPVRLVTRNERLTAELMREARVLAYGGDTRLSASSAHFPHVRLSLDGIVDGAEVWFRTAQIEIVAVARKDHVARLRGRHADPASVEAYFHSTPNIAERELLPAGASLREGVVASLAVAESRGSLTLPAGTVGIRSDGVFYPFRRDEDGKVWPTLARNDVETLGRQPGIRTAVWFATTTRLVVTGLRRAVPGQSPRSDERAGYLRLAGRSEATNKAFESVFFEKEVAADREFRELRDPARLDFEALVLDMQHLQRNDDKPTGSPFARDSSYLRLREGMLLYASVDTEKIVKLYAVKMGRALWDATFREKLARYTQQSGPVDDETEGPFNWPRSLLPCRHAQYLCPACRLFGWVAPAKSSHRTPSGRRIPRALRGRLRFARAKMIGNASAFLENLTNRQFCAGRGFPLAVLSSPKPNRAPFYMREPDGGVPAWDDVNSVLAGRKFYWNQAKPETFWALTAPPAGRSLERPFRRPGDVVDTQNALLTGWVKPGAQFETEIRFENVQPEELAALIACLELPTGCTIGLGMAKPLGFGRFATRVSDIQIMDTEQSYESFGPIDVQRPTPDQLRDWMRSFVATLYRAYAPSAASVATADLVALPFVRDMIRVLAGPRPAAPVHYPRISEDVGSPGPQIAWSKTHNDARLPQPCSGQTLRRDTA